MKGNTLKKWQWSGHMFRRGNHRSIKKSDRMRDYLNNIGQGKYVCQLFTKLKIKKFIYR